MTEIESIKIKSFLRSLPPNPSYSFSSVSSRETGKSTHGYHRYPAKFIPQLAETILDNYTDKENAHVNDPFMGSGTTIVSALTRGHVASGTDINRIAYLTTNKGSKNRKVYAKVREEH